MRYFAIFGIASTLLIPFMVDSDLLYPAVSTKVVLFRAATCLMLIGMATRIRLDPIGTALLTLLAAGLVSDFLGPDWRVALLSTHERMDGWMQQAYLTGFYFAAVPLLKSEVVTRRLFRAMLVLSVLVTLTAFTPFVWQPWDYRPMTMFGNPTYYGGYALWIMAFAAWRFRWRNLALIAMCAAALLLLRDRGALVGLAVGFAVWVALTSRFWAMMSLYVSVAVIFLFSPIIFHAISRILASDPDIAQRLYIWRTMSGMALHAPLWGYGHEGVRILSVTGVIEPNWDRAHNLILDWLSEGGLVGLACHAWIGWLVWRLIVPRPAKEKAAFAGAFAAYLGNGMFAFDTIATAPMLYLSMAYLTSRPTSGIPPRDHKTRDIPKSGYSAARP